VQEEEVVLGSSDTPSAGRRIGAGELGEAKVRFLRMALTNKARLVCWVGARKGAAALMASRTRQYRGT
jgi:hypothetical protein